MDFAWPEGMSVDVKGLFDVIQNKKDHGWAGHSKKRKALARTIYLSSSGELEESAVEELLTLLERHHEFQ